MLLSRLCRVGWITIGVCGGGGTMWRACSAAHPAKIGSDASASSFSNDVMGDLIEGFGGDGLALPLRAPADQPISKLGQEPAQESEEGEALPHLRQP